MTDSPAEFWWRRARRLRRRVNLARTFDAFAAPAFAVSLAGVAAILTARGAGAPAWRPALACLLALVAVAAIIRRRVRFETEADALARLDLALGLHTRLSSAAAGVGSWPAPVPEEIVRLRRSRASDLCLAAASLLVAATFIPVGPPGAPPPPSRPEPPAAIRDFRATIRRLGEEKAADPRALTELEAKADALMRRPESAWYDAAAMEAAEHLRDGLDRSLRDLDKDLSTLASATDRMAETGQPSVESLSPELARAAAEALTGMELSSLPPPSATRDALKSLAPASLRSLDAKQLDELRRTLADSRRRLRRADKGAASAAVSRRSAEGFPVFLFAPGASPVSLLRLAAGAAAAARVNTGLLPVSESEKKTLSEILAKQPPRAYFQSGCKPGMTVSAIVILPRPDPVADAALLDALEGIVYGETFSVRESEPEKAALLAALDAGRLRLAPFDLKPSGSGGKNGSQSQPGGALALAFGSEAGSGGPGGGGGPAPLSFGAKTDADPAGREALPDADHSRDTLGDVEGLSAGKHKVDRNAWRGPVSGGGLATGGEGAEAVWTDDLTPEERETLKNYFK